MKFRIPRFGKPEYQAPQTPPVPQGQTSEESGTFINEKERQILVKIVDGGKPQDLAIALGTLQVAADIVKQTLSVWHMKDARSKGILKIQGNGVGRG